MISLKFLVVIILFQVILAQPPANVPRACLEVPLDSTQPDCCKFPPAFSMKDIYKCGFPEQDSVLARKRPTSRDCPKYKCLGKKYNLMRDGQMDPELLYTFLDNYATKNPLFKEAVASAKKQCIGKQLKGMETCPPEKIMSCIFTVMAYECPGWQTDPRCEYMKEFMKVCPPYFFKF